MLDSSIVSRILDWIPNRKRVHINGRRVRFGALWAGPDAGVVSAAVPGVILAAGSAFFCSVAVNRLSASLLTGFSILKAAHYRAHLKKLAIAAKAGA
jgi:hypothetical protein